MVPLAGVEPARGISPLDFESSASANFTTAAKVIIICCKIKVFLVELNGKILFNSSSNLACLKIISQIFSFCKRIKGIFMEKLVLIDGNSLINRAFYAMPLLITKKGIATNAVYGFMNMFFKMLSDVKPTYVAVAFDVKAPTFRHKMFTEYKGTRKPMPDELRPQIPLLKELLSFMGVTVIEQAGIEADDIIGTIAKHTKIQTVIFNNKTDK